MARSIGRRGLLASMLAGVAASACGQLIQGMAPTPRTMKQGGRAHAYQTAAFIFTFAQAEALVWQKTIEKTEHDALPVLQAIRDGGHQLELGAEELDASGTGGIAAYELTFEVTAGGKSFTLPGKPGTDPDVYQRALESAADALKLPPEQLKQGHFALYGLSNVMTTLNAGHVTLQKHAFKLLALRAKLDRGEKADWFDPNRPKEESFRDIDEALRMIEADHRRSARSRASIIASLALADGYAAPGALDLLREQLAEDRARAKKWLATHQRPTAEDYGVEAAALPTADAIQEQIAEEVGFLGSLAKVAYGVVTANPGKAVEGLAELAPEDSTARTALEGVSAALSGDVAGAAEAIAELAGRSEELDDVKQRLDRLKAARAANTPTAPG